MKINRKSQFTLIRVYVTAFSSFDSNSEKLNAKKTGNVFLRDLGE